MPTTDIEDHNDIRLADGVTAYHGSPHEFEEFDPAFIGTGEGAQAYGHGLYFAENPAVAQGYRSRLAGRPEIKSLTIANKKVGEHNGFNYSPRTNDNYENIRSSLFEDLLLDEDALIADPKNVQELAVNKLKSKIEEYKDEWPEAVPHANRLLKDISKPKSVNLNLGETPGQMYEVNLNAGPEHFLDWDKPLSEQHPKIQEAVSARIENLRNKYPEWVPHDPEGEWIYRSYRPQGEEEIPPGIDHDAHASSILKDLGVRGIRYADQGSRGIDEKSGSSNYVIFDPKHIKVKRRYATGGGIKAFAIGNSIPHLERASDMIDTHDDIQLAQGVEPASNAPRLTDTAPFKKWFAGSKVVDENGDPLRLYHGTTVWKRDDGRNLGDFDEFDRMASVKQVRRPQWLDTIGSWFSDNPGERGAGLYAGDEEGGAIYPVHLNIKNPLRTDFDWLLNKAKELGPTIVDKFQSTPRKKYYKAAPEAYEKLHHWIKKQGYDGVIIPKGSAKEFEHQNVYIALHPTQIKSATGNTGDFNPSNPDIRKNTGGVADKTQKAYGGAITPGPRLNDENIDDFARRLILWSYATAPLFHKADGGAVDPAAKAVDTAREMTEDRQLNPMGFYSAAAEAASKFPQKAPIDQIINKIKGQPNVKKEELDNANLADAFAGQRSVDPQEVARHLQENVPQISEKVYGGKPPVSHPAYEYDNDPDNPGEYLPNADSIFEVGPAFSVPGRYAKNPWRIGKYKTGYKKYVYEVYDPMETHHDSFDNLNDAVTYVNQSINKIEPTKYRDYTIPGGENYREVVLTLPGEEKYKSSHWPDINPAAHLRMADRDNAKTLHLEELQSDWGQQGRREGFGNKLADGWELKEQEPGFYYLMRKGKQTIYTFGDINKVMEEGKRYGAIKEGAPTAPYVTDTNQWVDLGLKRALMEAAHGGYDKLIWTPGEHQVSRYDLSKQIDRLVYNPNAEILMAYKDGKQIINRGAAKDELEGIVGKDVAKNLLASEGQNLPDAGSTKYHILEGQDLSVGGEGMKAFYDKLVPQRLSKLVAQYDKDAKVNLFGHEINTGRNKGFVSGDEIMKSLPETRGMSESEKSDWWRNLSSDDREKLMDDFRGEKKMKAHAIQITPKLREAILKGGLPAFEKGGSVISHALSVLSKLPR